ncbi:MAG: HINT domain-containing protein [Leptospiraceae bacterium]|nr:hypothetical protein [Leptospiraceae bacterium]MCK6382263.1 HINT domain-containing protein [Leptospiraceae bacterium]
MSEKNGEWIERDSTGLKIQRWTEVKDLRVGDIVTRKNKSGQTIKNIRQYKVPPTKVYNIEVEDNHNYFVGEAGVWVHNYPLTGTNSMGLGETLVNLGKKAIDGVVNLFDSKSNNKEKLKTYGIPDELPEYDTIEYTPKEKSKTDIRGTFPNIANTVEFEDIRDIKTDYYKNKIGKNGHTTPALDFGKNANKTTEWLDRIKNLYQLLSAQWRALVEQSILKLTMALY